MRPLTFGLLGVLTGAGCGGGVWVGQNVSSLLTLQNPRGRKESTPMINNEKGGETYLSRWILLPVSAATITAKHGESPQVHIPKYRSRQGGASKKKQKSGNGKLGFVFNLMLSFGFSWRRAGGRRPLPRGFLYSSKHVPRRCGHLH